MSPVTGVTVLGCQPYTEVHMSNVAGLGMLHISVYLYTGRRVIVDKSVNLRGHNGGTREEKEVWERQKQCTHIDNSQLHKSL